MAPFSELIYIWGRRALALEDRHEILPKAFSVVLCNVRRRPLDLTPVPTVGLKCKPLNLRLSVQSSLPLFDFPANRVFILKLIS